jgi:hypothetical protein
MNQTNKPVQIQLVQFKLNQFNSVFSFKTS